MPTTTVHKTSVSIKKNLRDKLSWTKNRSDIINKALNLYFDRENLLQKTKENFLYNSIEKWLNDIKHWEIIALNPHNEQINDKLLEETLWS